MGKFSRFLICLVMLAFLAVGAGMVRHQANKVRAAQRVPAVILDKQLHSHQTQDTDGNSSTVYSPEITYRCDFDGGQVVSKEVYPLTVSRGGPSGRTWAQGILKQYEIGQQVEAWYNPNDATQSFLIREVSFLPYLFILAPGVILAVLIALFVRRGGDNSAGVRRQGTVATTVMSLMGAAVWKHYFDLAGAGTDDMVTPVMTVYFALIAIPFAVSLPKTGLAGRLKSALTIGGIFAFIGIWLGLLGGGLVEFGAGLFKSFGWINHTIGGPHWVLYTVPVLGGLGLLFGLVARETTTGRTNDDPDETETADADDSVFADARREISDEMGQGFDHQE